MTALRLSPRPFSLKGSFTKGATTIPKVSIPDGESPTSASQVMKLTQRAPTSHQSYEDPTDTFYQAVHACYAGGGLRVRNARLRFI